ncbi:MAG: hypothetical protein E7642_07375 [Ruminococcaceae bacterium]|nr:hypothetical protein [Oscillospiraceae bacterium]
MKKRLSCLLLSVLMIVLCFAGCAEKTGDEVITKIGEEASKGAVTLSMYLMSEEPVSAEQEAAMEAAVNAITEKEFKVRMDLRYFTPDQYYTRLDADLAEMTEFYDGEGIGRQDYEPVYTDEDGLPVTFYPPIQEFSVDIFYFGGYEKYLEYREAGYIRDITTEINGGAKALKAVVNNKLLEQAKAVNGRYDIVPVNRAIGEYTYLLLNKEVLEGAQYSANDITSLVDTDCQDLLSLVEEMYSDSYVPLKSFTDELNIIDTEFFSVDENGFSTDDFSLIAGTYNSAWSYGATNSYPEMSDIMNTKNNGRYSVEEQIRILKGYEFAGYYGSEEDADKPFAVGYIKGGLEVVDTYSDDYVVVPVALPTLKTEDLYEHMFAIAEDTNSSMKSAEVLTYLNTNEEFRNLILYGIENENYVWTDAVDEDGNVLLNQYGETYRVVSKLTAKPELNYVMDPYKTGNVTLIYTEEGADPRANDYALKQNQDLVVEYTMGFNLYGAKFASGTAVDLTAIKAVSVASKDIYAKIVAAKNEEELEAVFTEIEGIVAGDNVKNVLDMPVAEDATETPEGEAPEGEAPEAAEKVYTSVAAYYDEWLIAKKLKIVEDSTDDFVAEMPE